MTWRGCSACFGPQSRLHLSWSRLHDPLYIPLNFLGVIYREIKQALADMERMFRLIEEHAEVKTPPARARFAYRGVAAFLSTRFLVARSETCQMTWTGIAGGVVNDAVRSRRRGLSSGSKLHLAPASNRARQW